MYIIKYSLTILIAAIIPCSTIANISPMNSLQLILVTNSNWNSNHGKLLRYQRNNTNQPWQIIGASIDVMLGKNGIAKFKKEGDLRVPSGIFSLGTAFGFAKKADPEMMLPYMPITNSTVCVDDLKSPYYNQIIDTNKVYKSSWHSGEQMSGKIPQYKWGVVVNYNISKPIPGAGSCIFMHIWRNPKTPTVGCIAMSETNIKQLLIWLDPAKKTLIAVFPVNTYNQLRVSKKLPKI